MNYRYVFFGTPHIAQLSLEALEKHGSLPSLIITAPARPQGRGMHLLETPVAAFGREHDIPVITPEKITPEVIELLNQAEQWDFFLVVAYGQILPQALLDIVDGKVLNLHPSLLPLYRGPSPLESVLLSDDSQTGVSIMELDKAVDHGPIVAQGAFELEKTMTVEALTEKSAVLGIELFMQSINGYLSGDLVPNPQDHDAMTHTRKYTKADGNLDAVSSDWEKWKIFRALGNRGWAHFTATRHDEEIAVKITNASYEDETFVINEVIPENGKRQAYADFLHSLH
ncbi:MAG: methionyl-tRNA formyltransferase [Patescibacteria group bacterium]